MNSIACDDRRKLRDAVTAYMDGTIRTYAFDDINCECIDSRDESIRQISRLLYQIHDDTVDHPISVSQRTWETLLRIIVFLDTDLVVDEEVANDFWPFKNEAEWIKHRGTLDRIKLPAFDPKVHALPVHGPFDRIPALLGFGIIAAATALIVVFILIVAR